MGAKNEYYEDKQDILERDEAMMIFITMLRKKYTANYYHDDEDMRLIVYLETILEPKIKIIDESGCKYVHFDKWDFRQCGTRYELDYELFDYFTPRKIADLIEQDFERVIAKEVE